MSFGVRPVKATTATLIWLTATAWVLGGYVWPTLSNVEVAALQAMLHPALFRHDFAVQQSLGFTPRFYWDQLILVLARAGLPLAASFAVWQIVAVGGLVGAIHTAARELAFGFAAAAALTVWIIFSPAGTIAGVYFYTHAPVPAVWAGAAVAWGVVFALRDRRMAAFILFGVAVLLQFLVGFYAGILAGLLLWVAGRRPRPTDILPWAAALALVYLPMRFTGGTGSSILGNAAFVEIYARLRLPHHLVPSSWPWTDWVRFVLFYAGAWLYLHRSAKAGERLESKLLGAAIALIVVALALNYVTVELVPVAFFAKLQPARVTPLAALLAFGLLARRVQAAVEQRAWLEAAILVIIPLSPIPGLMLILAAILLPSQTNATGRAGWLPVTTLAVALVLTFDPFEGSWRLRLAHYAPWVALFLAQAAPRWFANRRRFALIAAGAAALGAAGCAYASLQPAWPAYLLDRFAVDARPHDPVAELGARFRARAPADAIVLVPPTGSGWMFKLYARRADVVDAKNAPFTDRGLLEWRQRMEAVLGAGLTPKLNRAAAWRARSPKELASVAHQFHAGYVLTRDTWHPLLPGRRIDTEQGWSLWRLP